MPNRTTPLERAFELARSGDYANVTDLKRQLRLAGYAMALFDGPSLSKQLSELIKASYRAPDGAPSLAD